MFLDALYNRAMAGDSSIANYVDRALRLAGTEKNERVIEQALASVVSAVDRLRRLRPESDDALQELIPRIERESLRQAEFAETPDVKRTWFSTYLDVASSAAGLGTARALLDGKTEVAGIDISPDVRWTLLTILSRYGAEGTDDLLQAESERDPSDAGAKRLLTARAAKPDAVTKAQMLEDVQDPQSTYGLAQKRAIMSGLFPANQTNLQLELLDDVLAALPSLSATGDPYFLSSYVQRLLQPVCRPESSAKMMAALQDPAIRQNSTTFRFLREALQADTECFSGRTSASS
jgi:aminopeptidase N